MFPSPDHSLLFPPACFFPFPIQHNWELVHRLSCQRSCTWIERTSSPPLSYFYVQPICESKLFPGMSPPVPHEWHDIAWLLNSVTSLRWSSLRYHKLSLWAIDILSHLLYNSWIGIWFDTLPKMTGWQNGQKKLKLVVLVQSLTIPNCIPILWRNNFITVWTYSTMKIHEDQRYPR